MPGQPVTLKGETTLQQVCYVLNHLCWTQTDLEKGGGSYGITALTPGLAGHGGTVKHACQQTLTPLSN